LRRGETAFTLLEVMIALTIFFVAVFAILGSVAQSLRAARSLQTKWPDPRALVSELSLTNKLEEGTVEGDFGDLHPDFTWTRDIYQVRTNGLFQIDYTIVGATGNRPLEWKTSTLLWRPDSQLTSFRRQQ
jgi:Tfp pilus assembly protein PilV